ncbi:MAG: class I SAM-dependent methyltransferase [Bacteroidota bacterium]
MQKYNLFSEQLEFDFKNLVINQFTKADLDKLILKIKTKHQTEVNYNLLFETIVNYRKACHKVPTLALNYCWLPAKSYEQASSELTAFYKSGIVKGANVLDLCGGLGVDDIAFASTFAHVVSLDINEELNQIVNHNFKKIGLNNIKRLGLPAEDYLAANTTHFDLIYADADRRPDSNAKKFIIEDCTPNIIALLPVIKQYSSKLLLKLSPLVDLSYIKSKFSNIETIYVVAVQNEVKEVLVLISFQESLATSTIAVNIIDKQTVESFIYKDDSVTNKVHLSDHAEYFFEPNLAIIKAGLSSVYANYCGLKMLAENSHFFVGDNIPEGFMGRSFRVVNSMPFAKSTFKDYLKQKQLTKVNISKRNFPTTVAEIYKQFKLKEGGDDYLFFTQNAQNEKLFYHCEKIE